MRAHLHYLRTSTVSERLDYPLIFTTIAHPHYLRASPLQQSILFVNTSLLYFCNNKMKAKISSSVFENPKYLIYSSGKLLGNIMGREGSTRSDISWRPKQDIKD